MGAITKRITGVFDALATGFTVGERLSKGENLQAVGLGLALAAPLLWRRRYWSLAGALGMAAVAYLFWEEFHEQEPVLEEEPAPSAPADPRVN